MVYLANDLGILGNSAEENNLDHTYYHIKSYGQNLKVVELNLRTGGGGEELCEPAPSQQAQC